MSSAYQVWYCDGLPVCVFNVFTSINDSVKTGLLASPPQGHEIFSNFVPTANCYRCNCPVLEPCLFCAGIAQALGCSLSWSNFQLPLLGGERAQCSSVPPSSGSSNPTPSPPAGSTALPPPAPGNVVVQRHRFRNLLQGGAAPGLPLPPSPPPGPASSTASGEVTLTSLIGVQDQLLQSGLVQEWQVRAVHC